ncbi:hypothetical protein IW140_005112 [Coemansia sp. RSA 1813]|nr:hypothetical protein EV178_004997 [Coemansia sp. RSA 1646]KAJ1767788.1 hypothetical protein LPJ74_005175 [Coemansia sp. RSA 1843]KAJ2087162.1 hypothetical protein IW138_005149 [Coemansia sp. RSA 986]KAJ2211997.1 hypothetical protein EV179_005041 [Coemansia sp. RSA 487]KAJ2565957.1 hypothetical protein IW140_005112 [Coemansia sp. RSA 1813]
MSYYRPLGQTFNQLNLHMYRLPDGQRGALRSTSLALAREASRDGGYRRPSSDSSDSDSNSHHSYNPFKGIKRLYTGFRKHRSRSGSSDDDSNRLRKFYSTPLTSSKRTPSPPAPAPAPENDAHKCKTTQTGRCVSDGEVHDPASLLTVNEEERGRSRSRSSSRLSKRVRFAGGEPEEHATYSSKEYDRRVIDPWEMLTKESRDKMREEMSDYTSHEMVLNNVYNTNDSKYCTLCWRQHCHCRPLSKDIWRRAKSPSMVRAGA